MQNVIKKSIMQEKNSKRYALNYYKDEAESAGHFKLDTKILDGLFKKKGKLFDSTMGRGRHVLHFAKKSFEVHGNDYNPFMIEMVREELLRNKLKARLYNLDATNLSKIKNNSFDYVICMYNSIGSIHRNKKRQKAINELGRIAKTGGIVVVHAHNIYSDLFRLTNILWTLKGFFPFRKEIEKGDYFFEHESLDETYQHLFTLREMMNHIENAGMKAEKIIYLDKNQNRVYNGVLKHLISGGFVFVCRKI